MEAATAGTRAGGRPWLERWRRFRDRTLADADFQRWAARFPLTRRIAARRASALFDLCAGFVYSQVLLACVRLDVFELLADGPRDADWIARETKLGPEPARTLLAAAASLGLLERRGGVERYGLGQLGAALRANPGALAMIEHHELLYADLADPVALLRDEHGETLLSRHWPYARVDDPRPLGHERVQGYTRLMSASQHLVARNVMDAYDFARHARLLDIGGGDGTFVATLAGRAPGLEATLFDLPAVARIASQRMAALGLASRTTCVGGSFLHDPLPRGADAVTLVRVLHDHGDEDVRTLLRCVRSAIAENGVLVVAEPMAGTRGAAAMGDAYFGLYLSAMRSGRPRTADELSRMLVEAGFSGVREHPTAQPLLVRVLVAQAPARRDGKIT
jgi:demethylspheroidene O-methyltransferase